MLFRGRQPASVVWRRFRSGVDEFTFVERATHCEARLAPSAERVVDLFHVFAEHLGPAVDVSLHDVRSGRAWAGRDLALPDVREGIARLKVPLAAYGGVELAVYTDEDQLTLTPDLALYIFARSDRWLYLLQGKGLVETTAPPAEPPPLRPEQFGEAAELAGALDAVAERMGLAPVAPGTGTPAAAREA
jgi:hypothetical protein